MILDPNLHNAYLLFMICIARIIVFLSLSASRGIKSAWSIVSLDKLANFLSKIVLEKKNMSDISYHMAFNVRHGNVQSLVGEV